MDKQLEKYRIYISRNRKNKVSVPEKIEGITRLDFWFKPEVTQKLSRIKKFIDGIEDEGIKLFFKVAFSETVRDSSNTRNGEFKIYRYSEEDLKNFEPDVLGIMAEKLKRNRIGQEDFLSAVREYKGTLESHVYGFNTVDGIPAEFLYPKSVDIVVTSPPYGDSHTTVAYGQYSRLSATWLELEEPASIDRRLMGGKIHKRIPNFACKELNKALVEIKNEDQTRAFEVASFYADLLNSIKNISQLIRRGGYACYVVGNRRVKGVTLPTDKAVQLFFQEYKFDHVETFLRSIPNKRMPLKNSPTNVAGAGDTTMINEYIVVMKSK